MDEIRLPQHIANRVDRRWAARFRDMPDRPSGLSSSLEGCDPLRSPQVRRLLEGSLTPPIRPGSKPLAEM